MSLQKKYCRKSLSFLTPQSRKTQSSQQKLSSSNDQTPEHLLGNLLNDPLKRALLMEVLSQDSPKTKKIGIKDVESKKNQKFKYESPSALCRRRALAKMQGPSSSSDVNNTIKHKFVKVPFNKILKGVTAYVEITSHGKDRSAGVKSLMRAMGANIRDVFCRDLTHVVFKDGLYNSYQKARLLKVHLVSVLWVDAARRHECRMPEKYYPAIGSNAANVNVSLICQQFQKDYEDVLQEELNRSKNLSESILPDIHSEDVINTSQNCNAHSISVKKITKCKPIAVTPNSMYLDSTPDVTSDTDSEHYFIDNKKSFQKNNKESDNGICTKDIADQNTKNANTDLSNLNIKLSETCSQIEELSSLRISTDSDRNTDKQRIPQTVLDFQNVTQRKKKVDIKNKVNILEQHVLMPNISSTTEASCEKELNDNVENNNFLEKEINYDIDFAQEVNHKTPLKKIVRKLYNPDDIDISICGENTELKFTNKASPILSNVSDENTSNTEKNKKEIQNDVLNKRSSLTTPKNVSNLKMKKFATTPRRRSSRLFQYQNTESPQKRLRRSSIDENYTLNVLESDENDALLVTNNKQIANDIINNDEVGYMGENEENCNISGKLKTPVNKTASKNHCTSRRTLDFEADKCKNSPLKNNTISKSILQRNNTVTTSEEEKHNDIFVEPKNNSFLKSSRRSARISSFRNVHTTPKKESVTHAGSNKKTPGKKNIINNNESLNRKNGKLAENNVDSSDEFIYNQIENQKSSYDRECSSDNLLNKNSSGKKKLDVSNSNDDATTTNTQHKSFPYKLRRSTADFIPKEPIQTQNRFKNNTPNSKLKLTQRNKPLKKTSIVCTRFHSTEVQVFQQIVKKLGVFFVEDEVTEKTTHLVVAEPRRTVNLLRAIARGCWILKSEWLYRSLEANHWLSEEDYELCDFSNAVQKSRQERQAFGAKFSVDIFQNCGRIYVSRETNPRCSDLQELVTLCKGTITTITRNADIIVGEYIENKSCVTVNWIMDSVTFYKRKSLKNYVIDPPTSD